MATNDQAKFRVLMELAILLSLAVACANACPEYNTDFHGNDLISFENAFRTDTWAQCAQSCRNYSGCTHWTWLEDGVSDYDYAQDWGKCLLKTARKNVGYASKHISGARNCY
jgi:hypothetical protein